MSIFEPFINHVEFKMQICHKKNKSAVKQKEKKNRMFQMMQFFSFVFSWIRTLAHFDRCYCNCQCVFYDNIVKKRILQSSHLGQLQATSSIIGHRNKSRVEENSPPGTGLQPNSFLHPSTQNIFTNSAKLPRTRWRMVKCHCKAASTE